MKKPDRFERVVLAQFERWRSAVGDTAQWHCPDVINLLRKEHRWVERMVKQYRDDIFPSAVSHIADALLSEIKQRRK